MIIVEVYTGLINKEYNFEIKVESPPRSIEIIYEICSLIYFLTIILYLFHYSMPAESQRPAAVNDMRIIRML